MFVESHICLCRQLHFVETFWSGPNIAGLDRKSDDLYDVSPRTEISVTIRAFGGLALTDQPWKSPPWGSPSLRSRLLCPAHNA